MARSVFRFRNRDRDNFRLVGREVYLRFPHLADHAEWASLRERSRAFLEPWEPRWPGDDLTRSAFQHRIRRYEADFDSGLALPLLVCLKGSNRLAGGLTIGSIRRGASESCMLGYWMGEPTAGKGLMGDALATVLPHVFDKMQLHRIEAACIPDNARSLRLLEKVGFRREGYLNGYLKINGAWRDHLLYALLAEDFQTSRANTAKATG